MIDIYEEIGKRKTIVEDYLDELFQKKDEHILWELMSIYPMAGGKKFRPFLAMISAGAFDEEEEKALHLGVCIELIHNFTLVHDDIMDDDELRRGVETVYKREGMSSAINTGDALFALAFEVLSKTDIDVDDFKDLLCEVASSVVKVAEGQEEDMRFERSFDITEEEFIGMIEKKTSCLFQACTKGGAIVGGASKEQREHMKEYARKMGIAFQIQDDYLDLVGEQEKIGKPVGSDIKSGKRTLIIIHALGILPDKKRERLIEILNCSNNTVYEVNEAMDMLEKCGSMDYAKKTAEKYAAEAKEELKILPESKYREILDNLVDLMIQRTN
ncbi:MAG: polyprenyl synthetase family protein [Thermoplasmata archaeon]